MQQRPTRMRGWMLAACLLVSLGAARGGQYDDELKYYDYEIECTTLDKIALELTPEQFAKQNNFPNWPLLPPALPREQVQALVDEQVERVVEEKFPSARLKEIPHEAQQVYRIYQVGEKVRLHVRLRGVDYTALEGVLHIKTPAVVQVGDTTFSTRDIHQDDQPHFDREAHERAVQQHINRETRRYNDQRNKYESEQRPLISDRIFTANRYLSVYNEWRPAKEFFEEKYAQRRQQLYQQYQPQVRMAVLRREKWHYDRETAEWLPEGVEAGKPVEAIVVVKPPLEEAKPILEEIVGELYPDRRRGGPSVRDEAPGLFPEKTPPAPRPEAPRGQAPPPPEAPRNAAPPPAPAPQGDVGDLYDEG